MEKKVLEQLANEFCEAEGIEITDLIDSGIICETVEDVLTKFLEHLIEKGEVVELKDINVSQLEKDTIHAHTDCRSSEGITVGLIDSLMSISRVLYDRLRIEPKYNNNDGRFIRSKAITEALRDLITDEDYIGIKNIGIHNSKKQ